MNRRDIQIQMAMQFYIPVHMQTLYLSEEGSIVIYHQFIKVTRHEINHMRHLLVISVMHLTSDNIRESLWKMFISK